MRTVSGRAVAQKTHWVTSILRTSTVFMPRIPATVESVKRWSSLLWKRESVDCCFLAVFVWINALDILCQAVSQNGTLWHGYHTQLASSEACSFISLKFLIRSLWHPAQRDLEHHLGRSGTHKRSSFVDHTPHLRVDSYEVLHVDHSQPLDASVCKKRTEPVQWS